MVAAAIIGTGFAILTAGCLLMQRRDRPGRIIVVTGAAVMLAGMVWQGVAMLF